MMQIAYTVQLDFVEFFLARLHRLLRCSKQLKSHGGQKKISYPMAKVICLTHLRVFLSKEQTN